MQLVDQLQNNKKLLIIIGAVGFLLLILVPLLIGLSTPSKEPIAVNPTAEPKPSKVNSGVTPAKASNPFFANRTSTAAPTPDTAIRPPQPTAIPTVDFDKLLPTVKTTPTPTPKPGPFYIANGKQNDLIIRLYLRQDWDQAYEVQVINTKTTEVRIIGYTSAYAPGDSAYFSKDFSQIIFIGGSLKDYQRLSIYSIPRHLILRDITLADIKRSLPALQIQPTAILSRLVLSPDYKKVAFSYGNTFNVNHIDPNTYIIAYNLSTNKMQIVPVRGLANAWKDNETIIYETNSSDPNVNTQSEIKVSGL